MIVLESSTLLLVAQPYEQASNAGAQSSFCLIYKDMV